ncbi:MAG: hypothetical protein D3908_10510, partial [Candidatus Electrothrix sp. AUS4]|nr:hypothetical protein [Candidatus Electrothrix sp. AUS4]
MMSLLLRHHFNGTDIIIFKLFIIIVGMLVPMPVMAEESAALRLHKGPMANYGATPWSTADIKIGENKLRFGLDTGGSFMWATSDLCTTCACDAHAKVATCQTGFQWLSDKILKQSFGPWGDMDTRTGEVEFSLINGADKQGAEVSVKEPFYASVNYTGNKFKYMDWDGGIAFPSDSRYISGTGNNKSGFLFKTLLRNGIINKPFFSIVTDRKSGEGRFYLGMDDKGNYIESSKITLK